MSALLGRRAVSPARHFPEPNSLRPTPPLCPFTFPDGSPCRLPAGHDSWHNAGLLTRPQPFDPRDADPLVPDPDHYCPGCDYCQPRPRRRGCSVIPFLLAALFWGPVAVWVVTRL